MAFWAENVGLLRLLPYLDARRAFGDREDVQQRCRRQRLLSVRQGRQRPRRTAAAAAKAAVLAVLATTRGVDANMADDFSEELPNFDCWGDFSAPHDVWADLYDLADSFQKDQGEYGDADGSTEGKPPLWQRLRAVGARHLESLLGYSTSGLDSQLHSECRYGFIALRLGQWMACLLVSATGPGAPAPAVPPECAAVRLSVADVLAPPTTIPTLLNSRWARPFCGLAEFARSVVRRPSASDVGFALPGDVRRLVDCLDIEGRPPSGIDWTRFRSMFGDGTNDVTTNWLMKTLGIAFQPGALLDYDQKMLECPLGFITIVVEKAHLAQSVRTEEYGKLVMSLPGLLDEFERRLASVSASAESAVAAQVSDPFGAILGSTFPVVPLLCSMSKLGQADTPSGKHGYQHKPYMLDFRASEIMRPPEERARLTQLRELPVQQHRDYLQQALASVGGGSRPYSAVVGALTSVLDGFGRPGVSDEKLLLVTMLWGARLARYLPGAIKRASAFGHGGRYLVFCLDEAACEVCLKAHPTPQLCVEGTLQTIYNKYTVLAAIVQLGFDAVYLDFDTLLLADPVPVILRDAQEAEVLVSRDFGAECLNTGVIYFKAHPDTAELLTALLGWLWHHPYEFSQKAFSAFLRHENATDARVQVLPLDFVPRWRVLDPVNGFVTSVVYDLGVEGWTGRLDGILIFHFLDGTGGVDPERAVEGRYLNLYDLFYDNPRVDLEDLATPLWVQDQRIERVLLRSRLPAVPATLIPCMLMDAPTA